MGSRFSGRAKNKVEKIKVLSRKNKGIKYLLCAIDLYSKYAFVIPLKGKKGINIVNAFNNNKTI